MRAVSKRGGIVLIAVAAATAVTWLVRLKADETMFVFFVAAAVVVTWAGGWKAGVAAAALSTVAVDWFFLEPAGSIRIANSAMAVRLVSFLSVAALVVVLTDALRVARRRAELALRDAEAARAIAERASQARGEFLRTLSHEVRTPINALLGYADLLEAGVAGAITPGQREYVERVRTAGKHLLTVVNDVLDIAKIDAGHLMVSVARLSLGAVVEAAVAVVLPQATAKGLRLEIAPSEGEDVECAADPDRVRQIVVNLLSNAAKFTPPDGQVVVGWGARTMDKETPRQPASVWLRVRDTGVGIAATDQARIFEPFEQVPGRQASGGTGLGLAISRRLARQMGGELVVESAVGRGSTFTLWLPGGDTAPTAGSHPASRPSPATSALGV